MECGSSAFLFAVCGRRATNRLRINTYKNEGEGGNRSHTV
jgi:hypothetical protein